MGCIGWCFRSGAGVRCLCALQVQREELLKKLAQAQRNITPPIDYLLSTQHVFSADCLVYLESVTDGGEQAPEGSMTRSA